MHQLTYIINRLGIPTSIYVFGLFPSLFIFLVTIKLFGSQHIKPLYNGRHGKKNSSRPLTILINGRRNQQTCFYSASIIGYSIWLVAIFFGHFVVSQTQTTLRQVSIPSIPMHCLDPRLYPLSVHSLFKFEFY